MLVLSRHVRYHVVAINSTIYVMRDNFSSRVIRDLERRVNNKCSNPDHRVPTSGPTGGHDNAVNIGVAAHICSAAPGGPRYDSTMTKEERSDISNGIWLCQNCAGLIDRDERTYTVDLLKQWRRTAELRAREELGQIPISREHYDAMHSLVFGSSPRLASADPVAAMCRLTSEALEKQDPRFKVEVERTQDRTKYTYLARETVEFSLSVAEERAVEFQEKLVHLLKHGRELKIDSSAISLAGSPLFEHLCRNEGVFVLSPTARKSAKVVVELVGQDGNTTFFTEVAGEIVGGTETVHFQGAGLDGLFELELSLPRNATRVHVGSVINFEVWNAKELSSLSNFNRIWAYYECARDGRSIRLGLEVDGQEVALLQGKAPIDEIGNFALLVYTFNARKISAELGHSVYFDASARINWDNFDAVYDLRLRMELVSSTGLESNPTMTLEPPPGKAVEDVLQYVAVTSGVLSLEQECESLLLFKQVLPPFKLIMTFSNARMAVVGEPENNIVKVEIVPLQACALACTIQKLA